MDKGKIGHITLTILTYLYIIPVGLLHLFYSYHWIAANGFVKYVFYGWMLCTFYAIIWPIQAAVLAWILIF